MFRFTLFPLILLFGSILFGCVLFYIYRRIKRSLQLTYKKGAEIAHAQQEKWREKEQRKKLPEIVQKGFDDLEVIELSHNTLPEEWQNLFDPIIQKAREILYEAAADQDFENTKLNSMRTFFIHTLDALRQFVQKLSADYKKMSEHENQSARENINVIKADLEHHQKILNKKRKFEFAVLMDVIKARLKS